MSNSVALRGYGARNSAAVAGYAVLVAPAEPVEPPVEPPAPSGRGYRPPRMWVRVPERLVWRCTVTLRLKQGPDRGPRAPPKRPQRPNTAKTPPKRPVLAPLGTLLAIRRKLAEKPKIRLKLAQNRAEPVKTALKLIRTCARPQKAALTVRRRAAERPELALTVRRPAEWRADLALTRYYGLSTAELVCLLAVDPGE